MRNKFANLDEIKAVIICNMIHFYGNENFFGSGDQLRQHQQAEEEEEKKESQLLNE